MFRLACPLAFDVKRWQEVSCVRWYWSSVRPSFSWLAHGQEPPPPGPSHLLSVDLHISLPQAKDNITSLKYSRCSLDLGIRSHQTTHKKRKDKVLSRNAHTRDQSFLRSGKTPGPTQNWLFCGFHHYNYIQAITKRKLKKQNKSWHSHRVSRYVIVTPL